MSGNSTGKYLVLTCFGESHGSHIGAVIDGCPAGLPLTPSDIQAELNKRKPGFTPLSTTRREEDHVEILSGVFNGLTTGAPICLLVKNQDFESEDYEKIKCKPRPGHADYAAYIKYGGFNDYRGGGRFSGRITISYVMAGAIAKKLLSKINVEVLAHTIQIGKVKVTKNISYRQIRENVYKSSVRCAEPRFTTLMEKEILKAKEEKDSVGGIVEGIVLNVPAGLGEPIFNSLDSDIAKIMFNIPAVKGVEFGIGFKSASLRGSENNDIYTIKKNRVISLTNNAGGILGGLSTGMPIVLRIAFKPTSSISRRQRTVDLTKMEETEIELTGRHDPCIVPRAVPIVESCLAFVIADHAIGSGIIPHILRAKG
ncbi:MAG: chorismate synthase [Candidatus Jordarchaeaceae archaeon]